jgi:uncharacterized OB-fold protein
MKPIELANRGEILSFTILQMPPEGFTPPLMMALVKLERDATVLCLLAEGLELPDIEVGTEVELHLDKESRLRFAPRN